MSSLHANDVHPELFKTNAHPGLWLDRFCPEIAICNQKGQKEHLAEVCGLKLAASEYLIVHKRHAAACRHAGMFYQELPLTLRWRMAIHLSRASALDNAAICQHPIYGFAYLPGSGLKGLARAYASLLWDRRKGDAGEKIEGLTVDEFKERFLRIFGWAKTEERRGIATKTSGGFETLRDPAFGGHNDNNPAQRGGAIFHDAWAEKYPDLEVDVTTCHYPDYYKNPKENPPGDWQEPIPITFLALAPGARFRFFVSGENQDHVDQAVKWLFGGLYWLGAGAKTAAGYGSFSWSEDEQRKEQVRVAVEKTAEAKRIEEANNLVVAKRQQEQATQALQNIAMSLKSNEVLMVPVVSDANQPASRTGYLLILTEGVWSRGPACALGKNANSLAKGMVFKVITKGTTNDKGQTEVQGPITPMQVPTPIPL